ncbi:Hypothetical_protein [Hexamita inflata]|uniref:Hypothetical_protein n=1 Tax=Hexamita inflata TaxID=28002 RepID=A0AA86TL03_9EUKA|nr:Hypothetical protein HINF_LOCUS3678 [Hexamita inflata]
MFQVSHFIRNHHFANLPFSLITVSFLGTNTVLWITFYSLTHRLGQECSISSGLVWKMFTAVLCIVLINIEVNTAFQKMFMNRAGRIEGQAAPSGKIVTDVVGPIHSFDIKVRNLQALKCGVVDKQLDFQQIEMRLSLFSNSMSNDPTIQHSLIYI